MRKVPAAEKKAERRAALNHVHRWPKPKPLQVPDELRPLIDKWNTIAVHHDSRTKVFRRSVDALKSLRAGRFFDDKPRFDRYAGHKFTLEEIEKALDRFNLRRNRPEYRPQKKNFLKGLSLEAFLWNPRMRNGNETPGGSVFIECLEQPNKLIAEVDPTLTDHVRRKVYEAGCGKLTYTEAEQVAARMRSYFKDHRDTLHKNGVKNTKGLVSMWVSMCSDKWGTDWGVGHFLGKNMPAMFEQYLEG